jgi:uroporphyrinogen-III synthase/uroporphyrinogen III methyltransferase/synthase
MDQGLQMLVRGELNWLILISTNATQAVAQRLNDLDLTLPPSSLKVASIGSATAKAASKVLGFETILLPGRFVAESLAEAITPVSGARIFLPQSELARPVLAQGLLAAGASVFAVDAYRTVRATGGDDVPVLLATHQVDVVTFTSASAVHYFVDRLLEEGGDLDYLDGVCLACIGPVVAEAVREAGLQETVLPETHTLQGLVDALDAYFQANR